MKFTTHCNTLQHTATHCNTLQHPATHVNTPPYTGEGEDNGKYNPEDWKREYADAQRLMDDQFSHDRKSPTVADDNHQHNHELSLANAAAAAAANRCVCHVAVVL